MTKKTLIVTGAAVILLVLALILFMNRCQPLEELVQEPVSPAPDFQPMRADVVSEPEPVAEEDPYANLTPEELAIIEMEEEPIHWSESGMNPEDQPRTFYVQDFTSGQLPEGFTLHGVRLTERGFELEPAAPGQEGQPRIGMVESPPMPFDFDSNAIAPLWKDVIPEGSSLLVEVSVSPDGQNWGMWHTADIDHDSYGQIEPFYPDGTPNPNYGYTPGGQMIWGNMTWKYFRYNIAFYSETAESPSVSSFRAFYQDSTMGEGRMAELNVADEMNP
jgi:hypothetical protein